MKKLIRSIVLVAASLAVFSASAQSSVSQAQLSAAIEQARADQVDALAPAGFAQAAEALANAQRDAERGRDAAKINERLRAGMASLQQATTAAAHAREALQSVVATRRDALNANAPKLATEAWRKADERFRDATAALEGGDTRKAQQRAAEADVLMRDVEMAAIRNGVLNEARAVIAQADAAKVEKFAPRTIASARRYLLEAEQEINRNRYEPAAAQRLAAQATYEARHSLYLSQLIDTTLDRNDGGLEELLLSWEGSVGQAARAAGLDPRFDQGIQPVAETLATEAQKQRQESQRLTRELEDRNGQVEALTAELEKLEARLGGISQERIALQRRVDAQERTRANIATIESSFTPAEARVYRQSDDVVISLTGIRFATGRSNIDAANVSLMNKVRDALALFPDSSMVIEGHTDSNGSDSTNLILSQDRADAVRQYLVTTFGINPEKVSSIGYGEARPVATNETADGRARNRRIDLIIHTQ